MEKVLFIVNPISGSGDVHSFETLVKNNLDANQFASEIKYTTAAGEAFNMAKNGLTRGIRWIVAVGGDGTVNEVGKALINTDGAMGVIPRGSGNGLARHLRIPMATGKAIRVLNLGKIAMLDYGVLNDVPFFCTAGLGFDAYVGDKFSHIGERGFVNYVKTTLSEYFTYKSKPYKISFNNQEIEKEAFLITIANASQWGNNAFIAPEANMQDGMLDVAILSPFPKYVAPSIGIRLFSKKIDSCRYVQSFKVKKITIERAAPEVVHFDGEPTIMGEKLVAEVKPQALKVIIP